MATQNHRVGLDAETAPRELAELVTAVQHLARAQRDGDRIAAVQAAHTAERRAQRLTDRLLAEATADRSATRRGLAQALGLPSHGVLHHRIDRHRTRTDSEKD